MRIKFENLGPLKNGEMELKPFMVFIGPNQTDKTLLAYSIYSLLWGEGQLTKFSTLPLFKHQIKALSR
ncbi:MAG: hypothetical protein Kow0090_09930 [Myxococcota bacterium]